MSFSELRVLKDLSELDAGKVGSIVFPNPANKTLLHLLIRPDSGLWAGGQFTFELAVPVGYPHDPPKVTCLTKVSVGGLSASSVHACPSAVPLPPCQHTSRPLLLLLCFCRCTTLT